MQVTTYPNGVRQSNNYQSITGNLTLTEDDHGKIIYCSAADLVVTLPTATTERQGIYYTIITGSLSTGTGTSVAVGSTSDAIIYTTTTANVSLINTGATDALNDMVTVVCTGANRWNVVNVKGTWAKSS